MLAVFMLAICIINSATADGVSQNEATKLGDEGKEILPGGSSFNILEFFEIIKTKTKPFGGLFVKTKE